MIKHVPTAPRTAPVDLVPIEDPALFSNIVVPAVADPAIAGFDQKWTSDGAKR
jgi:hypothetical protein